jgi:hypothetical protein
VTNEEIQKLAKSVMDDLRKELVGSSLIKVEEVSTQVEPIIKKAYAQCENAADQKKLYIKLSLYLHTDKFKTNENNGYKDLYDFLMSKPDFSGIPQKYVTEYGTMPFNLLHNACKPQPSTPFGFDPFGFGFNPFTDNFKKPKAPATPKKMTQEEIIAEAQTHILSNDFTKLKKLIASTNPESDTLNEILKRTVTFSKWDLLKELCQLTATNKETQKGIECVLEQLTPYSMLPDMRKMIEYLCGLTSVNKPGKESISNILTALANEQDWELIKKILKMPHIEEPSQKCMEYILNKTTALDTWLDPELVIHLCSLTSNQPTMEVIGEALKNLAENKKWDLTKKVLEIADIKNKLSKNDIEFFLQKAASPYATNWSMVDYFCSFTSENKPGNEAIGQALIKLAQKKQWGLLIKILQTKDINKPSQEISTLILKNAAKDKQLEAIQVICSLPDKPTQKALEEALREAEAGHAIDVINYLNQLLRKQAEPKPAPPKTEPPKPPDAPKKKTPEPAAMPKTGEVPKTKVPKKAPDSPYKDLSQDEVAEQLLTAVTKKDLKEVKGICALVGPNKLNIRDVTEALKQTKNLNDYSAIRQYLKSAKQLLQLSRHIADLEAYGTKLANAPESEKQGKSTVALTKDLLNLTNRYTSAFFNDKNTQKIQQKFTSTLKKGFEDMGEHRAEWKIIFLNVLVTASIIGLLINYIVNGRPWFFKTKRQNLVEEMMNELDSIKNQESMAHRTN